MRGFGKGEEVKVWVPAEVAETTAAGFCKRRVEPFSDSL